MYDVRVTGLGDGTWYWHLYLRDERLNGGLSESPGEARLAAGHAISFEMSGRDRSFSCPPSRLRTALL